MTCAKKSSFSPAERWYAVKLRHAVGRLQVLVAQDHDDVVGPSNALHEPGNQLAD
jgi:hypothetical protein